MATKMITTKTTRIEERSRLARTVAALALILGVLGGCSGGGGGRGTGGAGGGDVGGAAAGGTSGGAGGGAALCMGTGGEGGSSATATLSCEACERASRNDYCPATLLTATYTTDPETGDQVAVGWGLTTLPTQPERDAGAALLHCLNVNACSTDSKNVCAGNNPVLGCFCGAGVDPVDCIGGAGVHGVCLAEFAAAAAVTPGGPAAGSTLSVLAGFVTTKGFEPTNAVGLAVNIKRCAIATPCPLCGAQ
jgi:hypothetical protein